MSSITGAALTAPRTLELRQRDIPPLGPTDVLVDVTRCGVCASDVDRWLGKSEQAMPVWLGHEPAGIVAEVGRDVTQVAPGDRVACWVENGGFANRMVTDERYCLTFDETCPTPEMTEPLACVVNSVELAAPALGDDVVIVGAGFMGLLLLLVMRARGPRTITVADVRPGALRRAAELGATSTVDSATEDLAERVREITDGRGADVTYEVSGLNVGLNLAAAATRMSGKLCIVGYHQGGTREIPLGDWNWMAYDIRNAHFRDTRTILSGMRAALRLMSAGVVDVRPLISHVMPLEQIGAAFEIAAAKPDGYVKAAIAPGDAIPSA